MKSLPARDLRGGDLFRAVDEDARQTRSARTVVPNPAGCWNHVHVNEVECFDADAMLFIGKGRG